MAAPPILDQWSTAPEYDPCHRGRISRSYMKRLEREMFFDHSARLEWRIRILRFLSQNWINFILAPCSESTESISYFVLIKVTMQPLLKLLASCPVNLWQKKKTRNSSSFVLTGRKGYKNHPPYCPFNGFKSKNMLWLVYMILKF